MDLRNGILTVGDLDITADIDPETVRRHFPDIGFRTFGDATFLQWKKDVPVDGMLFRIMMDFQNGKLRYVEMWPAIDERFPDGPYEKTQAELRRLSNAWLKKELGEADTDTREVTMYEMAWGRAQAASSFDGKSPYALGYILLVFY